MFVLSFVVSELSEKNSVRIMKNTKNKKIFRWKGIQSDKILRIFFWDQNTRNLQGKNLFQFGFVKLEDWCEQN